MKRSEYEAYVSERSADDLDLNYAVIAINGEAGEVAEWYKKFVLRKNRAQKHTLEDLKTELGDVLFYVTRAAQLNNWTLENLMETNKAKLDDRVAKKFRQVV